MRTFQRLGLVSILVAASIAVIATVTLSPVAAATPMGARAVASAQDHTCAILDTGNVTCWGANQYGQLGYGNTTTIGDDETPATAGTVDLGTGRTATAITTGDYHTCAILDTGNVTCWGNNQYGQLGYGNTTTIGDDETPATAGTVDLGTDRTATAITTGRDHTCAILDTGNVTCWGYGGYGRLGYGNTTTIGDDETPATAGTVDLGTGRTATAITTGDYYTCAILDTGNVTCWGDNQYGRLGYGNTTTIGDDETPATAGTVDLGTGRTATAITTGDHHTCAILDTGNVTCWGYNSGAQLGYGNTTTIGDDETPATAGTVDLGTGRTATAITTGRDHTCAILDTGNVTCWGFYSQGQLGYGNTVWIGDDETPATAGTVDLGTGRTATAITTGDHHTCAILDTGYLTCWGYNSQGQLGYGNTTTIGDDETPATAGTVDLGTKVAVAAAPAPPPVTRVAGVNATETAISLSRDRYPRPQSAGAVVVATLADAADGLVAAPLAVTMDAPLLLTPTATLYGSVLDEITRLLPPGGAVHVVGGTGAVDTTVTDAISAAGFTVVRHAGPTRYDTAVAVADAIDAVDPVSTVLVATGRSHPDALAAGAAAASNDGVVLLSDDGRPHPSTTAWLAAHAGAAAHAIGGPATRAHPDAIPVGGATRIETATAVAEAFFADATTAGVTRSDRFEDALTGGTHQAHLGGPILLTPGDQLAPATRTWLSTRTGLTRTWVYGGPSAISVGVHDEVDAAVE